MNNLEILKNNLHKNIPENRNFYYAFYHVDEQNIDKITPDDIVKIINHDCTICLCYGCRNFTKNYNGKKISNQECENYIRNYFSREFNPDTDNCQCSACRKKRGQDNEYHTWVLEYKNKKYYIGEKNLPEAKSFAINNGLFYVDDYPYIGGYMQSS